MKIKRQRGVTFIEVIIGMAITGIIMAVVTILFTSNSNILAKVDKKSELQLEAQQIQEQLSTVALECNRMLFEEQDSFAFQDSLIENNIHLFELIENKLVYKMVEVNQEGTDIILKEKILSDHISTMNIDINGNVMGYYILLQSIGGKHTEELVIENKILFRNSK